MRRKPEPTPAQKANKKIDDATAWLTVTVEAIDTLLDRVAHPGDYAPDLQAALDRAAVDMLRVALRDGDRVLELVGDIRNDIADVEENVEERVAAERQDASDSRDAAEGLLRFICQEPEQNAHVQEELLAMGVDWRTMDAHTLKVVTTVARGVCSAFLEGDAR
jgi:uncharacterized small protein (DUF1192 family)